MRQRVVTATILLTTLGRADARARLRNGSSLDVAVPRRLAMALFAAWSPTARSRMRVRRSLQQQEATARRTRRTASHEPARQQTTASASREPEGDPKPGHGWSLPTTVLAARLRSAAAGPVPARAAARHRDPGLAARADPHQRRPARSSTPISRPGSCSASGRKLEGLALERAARAHACLRCAMRSKTCATACSRQRLRLATSEVFHVSHRAVPAERSAASAAAA